MPYRVTTAGRRNGSVRRSELAAALSADRTGLIARFASFVEASALSTNVAADKILAFDSHDEVLDARRVRIHQAGGDVRAGLRSFRSSLWFLRREAFESLWQHGRRFVYGAVNGGNIGTEGQYGPFCLVVADPEALRCKALAVFPADTAQTYTDAAGRLDSSGAIAAATMWTDRSVLAICDRNCELELARATPWPDVLCAPDRYLEVVLTPLPLAGVDEVRIRTVYRDRVEELELRLVAGESLQPIERNEIAALQAVRRWKGKHAISMREL